MLSRESVRVRALDAQARDLVADAGRFVNFAAELVVVEQDPAGQELIFGKPRLRVLRRHHFGGLLDRQVGRIVGPALGPAVQLFCSPEQEQLILHEDAAHPRLLAYGAEGSGKTIALACWIIIRAIELTGTGLQIGATAPTTRRSKRLVRALIERMPSDWYAWSERDQLFTLANTVTVQVVSTHVQSEAEGSPVQGFGWACVANDEIQDSMHADADIESRGRDAPDGIYKRLCSCTPKDSSDWRAFVDGKKASPLWSIRNLTGAGNVFVDPGYWDRLRLSMSDREYQRRALGMDVGPERRTYFAWSREHNLLPRPMLGARDRTAKLTGGYVAVLGHDPGTAQSVTEVMIALEIGRLTGWWVIGEITTHETTTDQHIAVVLEWLQERGWQNADDPDSGRVIVRCDPQGDTDARTHVSVYRTWQQAGFKCMSAAYTSAAKPKGIIPKAARVDMVNRLLCNAAGERRLFVALNDDGKPAAPMLVKAFESSERDELGRLEVKTKGKTDWTHWPVSVGYGLWPYERVVSNVGIRSVGAVL